MSCLYPAAWLLLLCACAFCYSRPLPTRILTLLRLLLYTVLIAILAGTGIYWRGQAGVLIALVDRSHSMPPTAEELSEQILRDLEQHRPADCQLGIISFAAGNSWEKLPGSVSFAGLKAVLPSRHSSDLAGALDTALDSLPPGRAGRLLLLSDGQYTGISPEQGLAQAAARGLAVDWQLLRRQGINDLAIEEFRAPWQALPGEFYTLSCTIWSPIDQEGRCSLRSNDGPEQTYSLSLRAGRNHFSWRVRHPEPGLLDYQLSIAGATALEDVCPENNRARCLVSIAGRKPLLLLSDSPEGTLARLLQNSGLAVQGRRPAPAELEPAKLSTYAGVLLENVPAGRLGLSGMEALSALVQAGRLGLMMTGGRNAFASGGYYRSPLEPILPLALEQRQELRKNRLGLVVALDRSGSMSMPCGKVSKMTLANRATLEVFRLLHSSDEFAVYAIDSQAHVVFPLTPVQQLKNAADKILSIESMGGGIYTYTALHQGISALLSSTAVTRHLLLFADANDAEEPGEYRELLRRAAGAGITVSVVGLGRESDLYAEFLQEIAQLGQGKCYFTEQAEELPRIFAEDTFVMALNTFLDTPVRGDFTSALQTIARPGKFPPSLEFGGYNLCAPKAGSENILISVDEHRAPLAAVGYAGQGRTAALAAEAAGNYSSPAASQPAAGMLLSALTSWVLAGADDSGEQFLLNQEISNGDLRVELLLPPERQQDPFPHPPEVSVLVFDRSQAQPAQQHRLEWETPDRLSCRIPLTGENIYLPGISWPGQTPLSLAPAALPYSPEFRPMYSATEQNKLAQLLAWMAATGGQERLQPAEIWRDLPPQTRRVSLAPGLALLAILLLLLEVAERRLTLSRFFRRSATATPPAGKQQKDKTRPVTAAPPPPPPSSPPDTETAEPSAEPQDSALSAALRQARRK
ncbi:MAG: VWA domain-containing protein [Lentisphaerae bacterium]|nr:VWA domain-containing protein [Lentisphaerota bacterium]